VTDRFDCQMLMAVFSYLYFHMYIAKDSAESEFVDEVLDLGVQGKLRIFEQVGNMLVSEGVFAEDAFESFLGNATLCNGSR
jgi:hypothetical protein